MKWKLSGKHQEDLSKNHWVQCITAETGSEIFYVQLFFFHINKTGFCAWFTSLFRNLVQSTIIDERAVTSDTVCFMYRTHIFYAIDHKSTAEYGKTSESM